MSGKPTGPTFPGRWDLTLSTSGHQSCDNSSESSVSSKIPGKEMESESIKETWTLYNMKVYRYVYRYFFLLIGIFIYFGSPCVFVEFFFSFLLDNIN